MIEIENTDDIKLLKELISVFTTDDDVANDKQISFMYKLISEIEEKQKNMQIQIDLLIERQNQSLILLDDIKAGQTNGQKTKSNSKTKVFKKHDTAKGDKKKFEPHKVGQKEFYSIELEDEKLVHVYDSNGRGKNPVFQRHYLSLNVFELLIVVEVYNRNNHCLYNGEVKKFCSLFGMTKPQFSKIYYNLQIGKFDGIFKELDKMISTSLFTVEKGYIYRNDLNTGIDKVKFNELVQTYVNSNTPFLTIWKLIKENFVLDPFDILCIIKKSDVIFKILGD